MGVDRCTDSRVGWKGLGGAVKLQVHFGGWGASRSG